MSNLSYDFYTPEVYEHFSNPHHAGILENPDASGEVGNIVCGDMMKIYLNISPQTKTKPPTITDISFETYGCAAAIATSSVTTDLALGKTLDEALQITKDQVVKTLTDLPPQKIHCSILAVDALGEAIYNYLEQNQLPISADLEGRHQRILKAQAILEERYKAWTQQGKFIPETEDDDDQIGDEIEDNSEVED